MTEDVFEMETKQLVITPVGTLDAIELGCTSWNKRMQNELNDFAQPSLDEGDAERKIQNLNRIEEIHVFDSLISDEFIVKSDIYDGDIESKEEAESLIDEYFKLRRLLRIRYGHIDVKGYLTEVSVEESAQNENSAFRISFNLLVGVPMTGNQ